MNKQSSNIKYFNEFELTDEEQRESIGYVCYERVIYYLFKRYYNFNYFPLFYLDRFWGWKFSNGNEPIIPMQNGFQEFLAKNLYETIEVNVNELKDKLYEIFDDGHKISMKLWMKHFSDGTPYVTSVLLEGMDNEGNVYFSKHSAAEKKCCVKILKDEFFSKLEVSAKNTVSLLVFKYCSEIEKLNGMDLIDSYNYIFKYIYGYNKSGDRIIKDNEELGFSLRSLTDFAEWLRNNKNEFIKNGKISKHNQFKLNVHINNKIRPIQNLISLILNFENIDLYINNNLKEEINRIYDEINIKLNEVLKFASLLVQKTNDENYQRYIRTIENLSNSLIEYQKVNLKLQNCLITNNK